MNRLKVMIKFKDAEFTECGIYLGSSSAAHISLPTRHIHWTDVPHAYKGVDVSELPAPHRPTLSH